MTLALRLFYALFATLIISACSADRSSAEYFESAQTFLGKGKLSAAEIELKNLLKQDPKNGDARLMLGTIYFERGELLAAEKELILAKEAGTQANKVLPLLARTLLALNRLEELQTLDVWEATESAQAEVTATIGLSLLNQGKHQSAQEYIAEAIRLAPDSNYVQTSQAQFFLGNGTIPQARQILERVLAADPDYAPAWSILGDVEQLESNLKASVQAYSQAIELNESSFNERFRRALVFVRQREFGHAQEDVDALKILAPTNPLVNYVQGLIYFYEGLFGEAQLAFEKSISSADFSMSYLYLAAIHSREGNDSNAENFINRFLMVMPTHFYGRTLYAQISLNQEKYSQAEEVLRGLAQEQAQNEDVLNLLAATLLKQGKLTEATETILTAAQMNPDSVGSQVKQGASQLVIGNQNEAVEFFERALKQKPDSVEANTLLVKSRLDTDNLMEALVAAEAFQKQSPDSVEPYNLLGKIYLAAGKQDDARSAFAKAIAISPGDPTAHHTLALLALQVKDFDGARKHYQAVLEYDEGNYITLMKLAALEAISNNQDSMIGYLNQSIEKHPLELQPRILLANYFLDMGRPSEVSALFTDVDEVKKRNRIVLEPIARAQLQLKSYSQALTTLKLLTNMHPDVAKYQFQLAQAYAGLEDPDKMKGALDSALTIAPNYLQARIARARLLLAEQNYNELEKDILQLQHLAPKNPIVMRLSAALANSRGNTVVALQRFEAIYQQTQTQQAVLDFANQKILVGDNNGALALLEQWTQQNPPNASTKFILAKLYEGKGELAKANFQYLSILEVNSNDLSALNNLAWNLRDKDPTKALKYAKDAAKIAPESTEIMDTLVVILFKSGEVKEAQELLARALKISPDNGSLKYHSAQIDAALGQKASAITTLTKLLEGPVEIGDREAAKKLLEELKAQQ